MHKSEIPNILGRFFVEDTADLYLIYIFTEYVQHSCNTAI